MVLLLMLMVVVLVLVVLIVAGKGEASHRPGLREQRPSLLKA